MGRVIERAGREGRSGGWTKFCENGKAEFGAGKMSENRRLLNPSRLLQICDMINVTWRT